MLSNEMEDEAEFLLDIISHSVKNCTINLDQEYMKLIKLFAVSKLRNAISNQSCQLRNKSEIRNNIQPVSFHILFT